MYHGNIGDLVPVTLSVLIPNIDNLLLILKASFYSHVVFKNTQPYLIRLLDLPY